MTKDEIVNILKTCGAQVKFTKVDGTERIMTCTLQPSKLPAYDSESKRKKAENPDVISVWNIDLQEWRSFRVDSVSRIVYWENGNETIWEKTEV